MEQPNGSTAAPEQQSNAGTQDVAGSTASSEAGKGNAVTTPNPVKQDQPQVNYEAKYKELQRAYTQETQRRSQIERQWATIEKRMEEQAKHLAELRKQPYDRDRFLAEFQEKGPDALKPFWEEQLNALKEEHSKNYSASQSENRSLRTKIALMERRSDAENYPDFRKLEPVIAEMLNDPDNPIDFNRPIEQIIDVLYTMARQTSSAEALRAAEAAGAASAETKLVKESKTTVTGGGKAASVTKPDLASMTTAELRKHMIELNGVVDRD